MAYRTAAKVEAPPPRARPAPVYIARDTFFWIGMILSAAFVLLGVGFIPFYSGTSIDCTRAAAAATPRCQAHESGWLVAGGTTKTFDGTPSAIEVKETTVTDDTPATELDIDRFSTRPLDDGAAKAAKRDYDVFVAEPNALHFSRRVHGGGGSFFGLLFVASGVGMAFLLTGMKPRHHAIIIDEEVGELVVETVYVRGRENITATYPLADIQSVEIESVDDSDYYDLFATVGTTRVLLMRIGHGACEQVKRLIEAARDKRKEPDAKEASGSADEDESLS